MLPECTTAAAGGADKPDAEQPTSHPGGQLQVDGAALDNLEVPRYPLTQGPASTYATWHFECFAICFRHHGAVLIIDRIMDSQQAWGS